eukprot:2404203-Prymnesium_polylepis.3
MATPLERQGARGRERPVVTCALSGHVRAFRSRAPSWSTCCFWSRDLARAAASWHRASGQRAGDARRALLAATRSPTRSRDVLTRRAHVLAATCSRGHVTYARSDGLTRRAHVLAATGSRDLCSQRRACGARFARGAPRHVDKVAQPKVAVHGRVNAEVHRREEDRRPLRPRATGGAASAEHGLRWLWPRV